MMSTEQGLWLWVSSPDYTQDYLNYGRDNPALAAGYSYRRADRDDFGWTCAPDTGHGDLALLYRSSLDADGNSIPNSSFSNICWLIRTHGEPYPIGHIPAAAMRGWEIGTDYDVLYRFRRALGLRRMRADRRLDDWGPLRANFHGRTGSWRNSPHHWSVLVSHLVGLNPDAARFFDGDAS